jgi:hypothetical protein
VTEIGDGSLIHTSRKEYMQVTSAPVPNHYWPQMDELWDKSKDVKQRLSMRPAAVSRIRRILSADFIVAPTRKLDLGGVAMPQLTTPFRVHACGVNCSEPIVLLPSLSGPATVRPDFRGLHDDMVKSVFNQALELTFYV